MLFSIIYALVPKDESSSLAGNDQASQEDQKDDGTAPSDYEALITDETTSSDDSSSGESAEPALNDEEIEAEGYSRTEVADEEDIADEQGGGAVDDNDWLRCPAGFTGYPPNCHNPADDICPAGQVGVRPNCVTPCPAGQTGTPPNCQDPATGSVTLTKTTTITPARKFNPVGSITAKNIPTGTNNGGIITATAVLDIVALKEYSNGKKFYLTQAQLNEGSKVGYEASTLKTITTPPPTTNPRNPALVKKVIVLIFENKTYKLASNNMPKLKSIITQGKHAYYSASFSAGEADSYPEYIALGGGNPYGFPSNSSAPKSFNSRSIFGLAIQNGKSAKTYLQDAKYYKHDPWVSFNGGSEKTWRAQNAQGLANLANDITRGTLPTISMVVPNAKDSSHDEDIPKRADAFAAAWINAIKNGPDWKSGNLAIVTTYDEANTKSNHIPGQIYTTILHPYLATKGKVTAVSTRVDHYSLVRFYAEVAGVWVDNPRVNVKLLGTSKYPQKVSTASSMTSQLGLIPAP